MTKLLTLPLAETSYEKKFNFYHLQIHSLLGDSNVAPSTNSNTVGLLIIFIFCGFLYFPKYWF
jgi:hypothetical protein